jgi:hypothetical protein
LSEQNNLCPKSDIGRIRREGGGRKPLTETFPELEEEIIKLLEPLSSGYPMSSIRWTLKSTRAISIALKQKGFDVSRTTVMNVLKSNGYSLQSNAKNLAISKNRPDRNLQFEFINLNVSKEIKKGNPVISVDTKKKELVGNYKNNGQQWHFKGTPTEVYDHDFPYPSIPRATPYGILDLNENNGHVVIGTNHDTAEFAVNSIYDWWKLKGKKLYPDAAVIYITADCGGSNGYRLNLWKYSLSLLATKIQKPIRVSHFPPGTSKWNKVEHKLFSYISTNWRGEPLSTYETIVKLIANTRTEAGLTVSCKLDHREYKTGKKLSKEQLNSIKMKKNNFHGDWNYTILPVK